MFCEHTAYDSEVHDGAETDVRQILHHEYSERRKSHANSDFVIEFPCFRLLKSTSRPCKPLHEENVNNPLRYVYPAYFYCTFDKKKLLAK